MAPRYILTGTVLRNSLSLELIALRKSISDIESLYGSVCIVMNGRSINAVEGPTRNAARISL